jgi:hypothetical protein
VKRKRGRSKTKKTKTNDFKKHSMKTTFLFSIAWAFSVFGASAQIKSDRTVGDFTGIKAGGSMRIVISQGESNSLSIEGSSQELIDKVKTEVKDGVLELSGPGNKDPEHPLTVNVTVKSLQLVDAGGAADIRSQGSLKTTQLTIKSGGSSSVHLETEGKQISAELSGAGNVYLGGTADLLTASVSGAGSLKAYDLAAGRVVATTSGAGSAKVNPKESLQAKSSGAGDVIYLEEPKEKTVEQNGAGAVRKSHSKSAESANGDTTRLKFGHKKVLILSDGEEKDSTEHQASSSSNFKHWSGIDIGSNLLVNSAGSIHLSKTDDYMTLDYGKSISVAINLFEKQYHIYKNYVTFVTGLGFEFDHFSLQHNVSLRHDSSYTTAISSAPINYHKNNLNENLLTLPLMFEFNTSSNSSKAFHIAVGVLGGWKIGAKTRQRYEDADGKDVSRVFSNDYNLNPFRYSLTARLGYGRFTIYTTYALSEFFKPGRGPQLYPVTAGLHVSI